METRLKYLAQVNPPTPEVLSAAPEVEASFLPLEAVWPEGRLDLSRRKSVGEGRSSYVHLREGDIVLPRVTPSFEHNRVACAEGLANGIGLATTEVHVVRPRDPQLQRFLHYRLRASDFQAVGQASMIGVAGLKRVPASSLGTLHVSITALEEAAAIADFLDRECERISRFEYALGRPAGLIDEYSFSMRTEHQATGDLQVPLRRLAHTVAGSGFPHERQGMPSGDLPFVKASDLQASDGHVVLGAANWVTRDTARELRARIIPKGASVLPRIGEAMRKNTRRLAGRPLLIDNNLIALVPRQGVEAEALFEALCSVDLRPHAAPGPVPSVSDRAIRSINVPWGSMSWQRSFIQRSKAIRQSALSIQANVARTARTLHEYRDALITEAVTGQLDVSKVSESQMDERVHAAAEGALTPTHS